MLTACLVFLPLVSLSYGLDGFIRETNGRRIFALIFVYTCGVMSQAILCLCFRHCSHADES